jgi:hypothetical protein
MYECSNCGWNREDKERGLPGNKVIFFPAKEWLEKTFPIIPFRGELFPILPTLFLNEF